MARWVEVECPQCGHRWKEDLDRHQAQRVVVKGDAPRTHIEEYRFRCPQDGVYVIVPVEIEG